MLEDRVVNTIVKDHDIYFFSAATSEQSLQLQCETRVSDQGEQAPLARRSACTWLREEKDD